jgi:hypothetical protein
MEKKRNLTNLIKSTQTKLLGITMASMLATSCQTTNEIEDDGFIITQNTKGEYRYTIKSGNPYYQTFRTNDGLTGEVSSKGAPRSFVLNCDSEKFTGIESQFCYFANKYINN